MQNKNNSNVVFRRIRGRIIPIKLSGDQKLRLKEGSKGAAAVAGGIGLSMVSGNSYKKVLFKSIDSTFKGFEVLKTKMSGPPGDLFEYARKQAAKAEALDHLRKSQRLLNAATTIRKVAPVVGAGLAVYGAVKLVGALPKDKRKKIDPALVAGGSGALTFLAPKALDYSKKAFESGMYGKQGAFDFAKGSTKAFGPRLKDAFFAALKAKL